MRAALAAFALLLAFAAPAFAQDGDAPSAAELAAQARRKKLARLKEMTPEQRRALLAKYEKYQKLGAAERKQLEANLRKMRELSPDQVHQLREKQQRFAKLDPTSRRVVEARVGAFRKLAPEKQRALLEQAEAWKRLSPQEQQRIRALPLEQQRTAFRNALASHRRAKLLRKLTPAERQAIADVPDRELRDAIHGLMQKRRAEQMRRLPDAVRAQLAALPPGTERDQAFRRAIDGVNQFEREAWGLLTRDERHAIKQLAPTERSARMRTLLPELRERAMQRLPQAMRERLAGLPPEQQVTQMRRYRQQKMLERAQSFLKPEQRWLVSRLPKNDRLDWARELAEANRDRMVEELSAAQRTRFEQLKSGQREQWLRQWVAGLEPGGAQQPSKRGTPRDGAARKPNGRDGDSPRDRARKNAKRASKKQ